MGQRNPKPSGRTNKFRTDASPELAYVIGVIAGDGNLNVHGYNYEMLLSVTDRDLPKSLADALRRFWSGRIPTKFGGARKERGG
jgi:intein-encoded DNA endonuclease-like protein